MQFNLQGQGHEVRLPGVQDADDERVRHARPGGRPAEARRAGQTQRYFSYTLETVYKEAICSRGNILYMGIYLITSHKVL